MKTINYYVIGGQYEQYCYGGAETLLAAKRLAAKNEEHWDNWAGWHRPAIYAAADCVPATSRFFGEQMIHTERATPVAVYDMTRRVWRSAGED